MDDLANQPISIAVVSDVHIGNKARSADLCPYKSTIQETGFVKAFRKFVADAELTADYLVVAGDISSKALPDEFEHASNVISDVAQALKVKKDRIIFVPGNHDVDWGVLKLEGKPLRQEQRYDPITRKPKTVFARANRRGDGDLFNDPYFTIWDYGSEIFVGYNSSWHDDPELVHHYGLADLSHLEQLDKRLASISGLGVKTKIFVVHHHPIQFSKRVPEIDLSTMQHADALLATLFKYDFDLLIHGHKHLPNFVPHYTLGTSSMVMLGAGSFSASLETWYKYTSNLFHMVQIGGRDEENGCITGLVKTWSYLGPHGWSPTDVLHRIEHKHPFGLHVQPERLAKELAEVCTSLIAKNKKKYVQWSELEKKQPRYKNINSELRRDALRRVASAKGWVLHSENSENPILLQPDESEGP